MSTCNWLDLQTLGFQPALFFKANSSQKMKTNGVGDTYMSINGMELGLNHQIPFIERGHDAISH
jgi:hypothetical protein